MSKLSNISKAIKNLFKGEKEMTKPESLVTISSTTDQLVLHQMEMLEQDITYFLKHIQFNVSVKIVHSMVNDQGVEIGGVYEDNTIIISYTDTIKMAAAYKVEEDIASLLTLAHEGGHHIAGHVPVECTLEQLAIREYEAWINGRQIVQATNDASALSVYDHHNKRNVRAYCHIYGEDKAVAEQLYKQIENKMMEVIG